MIFSQILVTYRIAWRLRTNPHLECVNRINELNPGASKIRFRSITGDINSIKRADYYCNGDISAYNDWVVGENTFRYTLQPGVSKFFSRVSSFSRVFFFNNGKKALNKSIFDFRFSIFNFRFSIFDFRFSIFDFRFSIFDFRFLIFDFRKKKKRKQFVSLFYHQGLMIAVGAVSVISISQTLDGKFGRQLMLQKRLMGTSIHHQSHRFFPVVYAVTHCRHVWKIPGSVSLRMLWIFIRP